MTRVDHVAAVVRDLESARKFFIDAFGFTPGPVNEMQSLGIRSVFMKGENVEIELIQPVAKGPYWDYLERGPIGFNHVALEVKDLEQAMKRLEKAGVRGEAPFVAPRGTVMNLDASTTLGMRLQLFKRK